MKSVPNKPRRNSYYPLGISSIDIQVMINVDPEHWVPISYVIPISQVTPHPYGKDMEIHIEPPKISWKELKTMRVKKDG